MTCWSLGAGFGAGAAGFFALLVAGAGLGVVGVLATCVTGFFVGSFVGFGRRSFFQTLSVEPRLISFATRIVLTSEIPYF